MAEKTVMVAAHDRPRRDETGDLSQQNARVLGRGARARAMLGVVLKSLKKVLRLRVEIWAVAILLSLATLDFGRVAVWIGSMPVNLYNRFFPAPGPRIFHGQAMKQRFPRQGGWAFPPGSGAARAEDREAGYLVVARYHVPFPEPVRGRSVMVEIIDLNQRKVAHSWNPISSRRLERFNVLPDGSLLAGDNGAPGTATFRMDACSNVVWEQRMGAHHSFERGVDGNFWSPWRALEDPRERGFIMFSPAGEVLSRVTLSGALTRAGHGHLVHGEVARSHQRPFHMNDVEPVLQDGPFWRRGDLFVSLRNSSAVLLYRPATDEVLWLQAGPWWHQHDVDVVSDSEISVYSNNTSYRGGSTLEVLGANEVYVHDFATGETRSPWREAMRRHDVRTETSGGATLFADGSLMLEESRYGRILKLSPDGERVWSYVNRASDGMLYEIAASRWLDAESGAEVLHSIASRDC